MGVTVCLCSCTLIECLQRRRGLPWPARGGDALQDHRVGGVLLKDRRPAAVGGGEVCKAEQLGPFPSEGGSTHSDNHRPMVHTSRHSAAPPHPFTPGVGSQERGGTLGCRAVDVAGSLGRARHAAAAVWGRQVWSMHATRAITPRQVVFRHRHHSRSGQPATGPQPHSSAHPTTVLYSNSHVRCRRLQVVP